MAGIKLHCNNGSLYIAYVALIIGTVSLVMGMVNYFHLDVWGMLTAMYRKLSCKCNYNFTAIRQGEEILMGKMGEENVEAKSSTCYDSSSDLKNTVILN